MSRAQIHKPTVLIASGERLGGMLDELASDSSFRFVLIHSLSDANDLLSDLHFIGGTFEAVLIDYEFKDGLGTSLLKRAKKIFPDVPAAIVTSLRDSRLRLWTNVRGVDVLNTDLDLIRNWLSDVTLTVQR